MSDFKKSCMRVFIVIVFKFPQTNLHFFAVFFVVGAFE